MQVHHGAARSVVRHDHRDRGRRVFIDAAGRIGLSLIGKGQVWGRDFSFEEVSRDIPVTVVPPAAIRF